MLRFSKVKSYIQLRPELWKFAHNSWRFFDQEACSNLNIFPGGKDLILVNLQSFINCLSKDTLIIYLNWTLTLVVDNTKNLDTNLASRAVTSKVQAPRHWFSMALIISRWTYDKYDFLTFLCSYLFSFVIKNMFSDILLCFLDKIKL